MGIPVGRRALAYRRKWSTITSTKVSHRSGPPCLSVSRLISGSSRQLSPSFVRWLPDLRRNSLITTRRIVQKSGSTCATVLPTVSFVLWLFECPRAWQRVTLNHSRITLHKRILRHLNWVSRHFFNQTLNQCLFLCDHSGSADDRCIANSLGLSAQTPCRHDGCQSWWHGVWLRVVITR